MLNGDGDENDYGFQAALTMSQEFRDKFPFTPTQPTNPIVSPLTMVPRQSAATLSLDLPMTSDPSCLLPPSGSYRPRFLSRFH